MELTSSFSALNCLFAGNSASSLGGALYTLADDYTLTNCAFSGNFSQSDGGAIHQIRGDAILDACTFGGNQVPDGRGGAIFFSGVSNGSLRSCLVWGNNAEDFVSNLDVDDSIFEPSSGTVTYENSLIEHFALTGNGNLDGTDPSNCLLYTSPSPRDKRQSRMPSSA